MYLHFERGFQIKDKPHTAKAGMRFVDIGNSNVRMVLNIYSGLSFCNRKVFRTYKGGVSHCCRFEIIETESMHLP